MEGKREVALEKRREGLKWGRKERFGVGSGEGKRGVALGKRREGWEWGSEERERFGEGEQNMWYSGGGTCFN